MDALFGAFSDNTLQNKSSNVQASSRNISNPWTRDRKHPTDDILSKASQRKHHALLGSDDLNSRYNESPIAYGIALMEESTQIQNALSQMKVQCQNIVLENEGADVKRSEEMRTNLEHVKALLNAFESCVTNVSKLQNILAQPREGKYIKLEKRYHEDAIELFTNSSKMLSRLQPQLDTLEWHKGNSLDSASFNKALEGLSRSVNELQHGLGIIEATRKVLSDHELASKDLMTFD